MSFSRRFCWKRLASAMSFPFPNATCNWPPKAKASYRPLGLQVQLWHKRTVHYVFFFLSSYLSLFTAPTTRAIRITHTTTHLLLHHMRSPALKRIHADKYVGIISSSHLWGFLADTKGRRRVILPTLLLSFTFTLLSSVTTNFWLFVFFRYLNGFL